MGIKTVSVYTRADVASLHVSTADVAKLLPGPDAPAYTDGDAIIKIAKEENAQAIIPGYGFLSENADFAREVGKAGLVWVGPSPEAIEVSPYCHLEEGWTANVIPPRLSASSMVSLILNLPPTQHYADKTSQSLAILPRRPAYQLCLEPKV